MLLKLVSKCVIKNSVQLQYTVIVLFNMCIVIVALNCGGLQSPLITTPVVVVVVLSLGIAVEVALIC